MSENTAESTATLSDSKSHRPLKKARRLDPQSQHSAAVEALFEKQPDVKIPTSATKPPRTTANLAAPPEIVTNVQGSSAGAGSGEFHVYKASRRREYDRIKLMEDEAKREEDDRAWEEKQKAKKERDESKTSKNRRRREKAKEKKEKAKKGGGMDQVENAGGGGTGRKLKPVVVKRPEEREGEEENGVDAMAAEENGIVVHDDD